MRLSELGEDRFLERLRERVPDPAPHVALGIGDDAAALRVGGGEAVLVSTDVLVESVHFTRATLPPRYIGRKAVAVNASDIAAMGGRPIGLLLSLAATGETEIEELLEIVDGFVGRSGELGIDLVGGNLSRSPGPLVLDVTILGAGEPGKLLRRSGARPGEAIYVSGKLGASAEGLELLKEGLALSPAGALRVPASLRDGPLPLAEDCIRRHIDPEPRIELGRFLAEKGAATACIDLSDGLVTDLHRLCRSSRVGARIEEPALPIHPGVLAWERVRRRPPRELALAGGEDYELLFTVADESGIDSWREKNALELTRIGEITGEEDVVELVFREGDRRTLVPQGWDHFRRLRE